MTLVAIAMSGCADLSYYLHSIDGHLDIVRQTRAIDEVLEDGATDSDLSSRLQLVKRIREFAFSRLQLPRSGSYSEYADLGRNYVLKSLFAAAEFSVEAHQWCYPIVGCAGYRGYFDDQRLRHYLAQLQADNYDTYIARVPAYSTLGWFDDPVLNTFVHWPEYRLAGLIFHELAHQRLYIDGDTTFNESFAIAVQELGVELWLEAEGKPDALERYRSYLKNRKQVTELIQQAREELAELYARPLDPAQMRTAKLDYFNELQQRYEQLSDSFEVADGFANWFASGLNNAKLLSISTYHSLVPAFRGLFTHQRQDFAAFFDEVERIGELPERQREVCLHQWMKAPAIIGKPAGGTGPAAACLEKV